jgi:hypothetical protein
MRSLFLRWPRYGSLTDEIAHGPRLVGRSANYAEAHPMARSMASGSASFLLSPPIVAATVLVSPCRDLRVKKTLRRPVHLGDPVRRGSDESKNGPPMDEGRERARCSTITIFTGSSVA